MFTERKRSLLADFELKMKEIDKNPSDFKLMAIQYTSGKGKGYFSFVLPWTKISRQHITPFLRPSVKIETARHNGYQELQIHVPLNPNLDLLTDLDNAIKTIKTIEAQVQSLEELSP